MNIILYLIIAVMGLLMLFFIGLMLMGIASWFIPRPNAKNIEKWVSSGKASLEKHNIKRVFEAKEYEDEGLHFFVENDEDKVIYLCGQYLLDYQSFDEEDDDPEMMFPGNELTIYRDKNRRMIYQEFTGDHVQPIFTANAVFGNPYYKKKRVPIDGEILKESFDDLGDKLGRANN